MAVKIGEAANHLDFWNILLDFLQNDPALVAADQNWEVAWQHASNPELVLRGPGLSGDDQVLVGLRRRDNELTLGESVIDITGMTGIIPSATSFNDHVGNLSIPPLFFLDQNPMSYWIVANGRRFVVVLRISNVYQAGYGGLFLPYANPAAYPMPLFIGGSLGSDAGSSAVVVNTWRTEVTNRYSHFLYAWTNGAGGSSTGYSSSSYMLDPSGGWRECGCNATDEKGWRLPLTRLGPRNFPGSMAGREAGPAGASALTGANFNSRLGYATVRGALTAGLNGEFSLTPITLNAGVNTGLEAPVTYGILDGCFSIPGIGNVAENIVTVGGVEHLVVGDVQRNTVSNYWALALE